MSAGPEASKGEREMTGIRRDSDGRRILAVTMTEPVGGGGRYIFLGHYPPYFLPMAALRPSIERGERREGRLNNYIDYPLL